MSDYRVANRYAKSLIELAESQDLLEEIHGDMQSFGQVCEESRDFVMLLRNPIIKHYKKRAVLKAIFGGKVNPMTSAFFDIICRKSREYFLPMIATEFHSQYNKMKGIVAASVVTASGLNDDLREDFVQILKDISGKKEIELSEEIDTALIGGFILKIGDRQIDDSVSGKLRSLKRQLHVNA